MYYDWVGENYCIEIIRQWINDKLRLEKKRIVTWNPNYNIDLLEEFYNNW